MLLQRDSSNTAGETTMPDPANSKRKSPASPTKSEDNGKEEMCLRHSPEAGSGDTSDRSADLIPQRSSRSQLAPAQEDEPKTPTPMLTSSKPTPSAAAPRHTQYIKALTQSIFSRPSRTKPSDKEPAAGKPAHKPDTKWKPLTTAASQAATPAAASTTQPEHPYIAPQAADVAASATFNATRLWSSISLPPNTRAPTTPKPLPKFLLHRPPPALQRAPRPKTPPPPAKDPAIPAPSKPSLAPPATGPGAANPPAVLVAATLARYGIPADARAFVCEKCGVARPVRLVAGEAWLAVWTCAYCMEPGAAREGGETQVRWCWRGRHETRRALHEVRTAEGVAVEMPDCGGCLQEGLEGVWGVSVEERAWEEAARRGVVETFEEDRKGGMRKEAREDLERSFQSVLAGLMDDCLKEGLRGLVGPLLDVELKTDEEVKMWEASLKQEGWEGWNTRNMCDGEYYIVEGRGGKGVKERLKKPESEKKPQGNMVKVKARKRGGRSTKSRRGGKKQKTDR